MGVEEKGSQHKGSAPIGMLEQWNTGIMGSGRLGQWFTLLNRVPSEEFIGKTLLTRKLMRLRRINK